VKKRPKSKKRLARKRKPSAKTKELTNSLTKWAHELVAASKEIQQREGLANRNGWKAGSSGKQKP
jgi:hypothetical protein